MNAQTPFYKTRIELLLDKKNLDQSLGWTVYPYELDDNCRIELAW
jgi:hypothetical protein